MNNMSANFVKQCKMNWRDESWQSHTGYSKILSVMLTVRASFFFFLLCFVCIVFVLNNLALEAFFSTDSMNSLKHVSYWRLCLEIFTQKTLQVFLPHAEKSLGFGRERERDLLILLSHAHLQFL